MGARNLTSHAIAEIGIPTATAKAIGHPPQKPGWDLDRFVSTRRISLKAIMLSYQIKLNSRPQQWVLAILGAR